MKRFNLLHMLGLNPGPRLWIQDALKGSTKGVLHRQLKVSPGEKIPLFKLKHAAKAGGKLGRRARLALTLRNFKKGR